MNKAELIEIISKGGKISNKTSAMVINALISAIKVALSKGEKVTIAGLGTFLVSKRKERKGRNPQTGETITIPAGRMPKFRAGESLRRFVRND
ncbi:MAG: HU family DNA-binding protein [Nitrospinae bacterium]|nr:HU family DNA-binding protein [Nitrospinota bacterium]MBI5747970.1 HU family DNA-binding protein [Nitrospinota bacterium]